MNTQTAVITGAASGIGAALAAEAAARGMNVVLTDVDVEALESTAHRIAEANSNVRVVSKPLDVTDAEAFSELAATVFAEFGAVTMLFNNAGLLSDALTWERPLGHWKKVLEVNLLGVLHGIHAFLPRMGAQQQPAYVVNVASIGGFLSGSRHSAYGASKAAVISLTENLYIEAAEEFPNITVSVVCPGPVRTPIFTNASGGENSDAAQRRLALDHYLNEEGITASDAARSTFEGVLSGEFWVTTHPEMFAETLRSRADQLISRAAPSIHHPIAIDLQGGTRREDVS